MRKIFTLIILLMASMSFGCLTTKPYSSESTQSSSSEFVYEDNYVEPAPQPMPVQSQPIVDPAPAAPMVAPMMDDSASPTSATTPDGIPPTGTPLTPTTPSGPVPKPSYKLIPKPIAPAPAAKDA